MLAYEERAPPAHLAPFVRCLWTLRGEGDPAQADRILPDGSFEIVFHRGEPFTRDGRTQPAAMLVGAIRRPTVVSSSRHADVLGIRFRLGGFSALTGLHPRDFRDEIVDLRELKLTRHPSEPDRRVNAAVKELVREHGNIRIRDLIDRVGTTERTLERLFDRHVGLRPKELSRIIRFQAALRGIDAGYYDDSHRIHDFQEFGGITPSALRAERTELTDAFVGNLQDDAAMLR
jgi:AraC-like DNA-binding protein